ncbi:uncharacterized protein BDZ99DRAFT_468725 [Mytilinidion resinicola]|uniref:Uncharacterized protein n=1 Tax=Mytilinidion resinicola TaxID=574789 RepID=A0A6A6Y2A4_9PEZI|nr:uncharacterized protein BDZ99DRAFT_468725 [Mytilinidion resinicola]KAF2802769.1 hypothetical protein BDZ99DRAFT_468725 [Mytilinidion resinicola]
MEEPTALPGQTQSWRQWWPPKNIGVSSAELKEKPWIGWKPDLADPTAKPWLKWAPRDLHVYHHAFNSLDAGGDGPQKPLGPDGAPASSNAEGG